MSTIPLKRRLLLGCFVLVMLCFVPAALWLSQWATTTWSNTASNPRLDFEWYDTASQPHALSAWQDGYTYLFFGFFSCSQICPVRTHQMQTLEQSLVALPAPELPPVRFLFVTIDPANDTPQLRGKMIDSLSDNFFSARLAPDELSRVQHRLREKVSNQTIPPRHAGNLYLIGPDQRVKRIYSHTNIDNQWLLNDLQHVVLTAG